MSVRAPNGIGVVVRLSPQARTPLRALREKRPHRWFEDPDGHLVAVDLGGGYHVDACLARLTAGGLVRGLDFVVTSRGSERPGVRGKVPEWLYVRLLPTGNPPELEAKMEPEVRAMWKRARGREYSLVLSKPARRDHA